MAIGHWRSAFLPTTGGSSSRRPKVQGTPKQYTAEEKGKQKALYQPIGDSQEARELEESLLLSRLQVAAGSSTRKVVAMNDPNLPGGELDSQPSCLLQPGVGHVLWPPRLAGPGKHSRGASSYLNELCCQSSWMNKVAYVLSPTCLCWR